MWKSIEVENSNKLVQDYYINNLEPSTLYELRMFAQNKLGNSTVTDVHSILTKGISRIYVQHARRILLSKSYDIYSDYESRNTTVNVI